jgi:meso-butanediol dehydrogenase / (S,S)-butanediol dehydrogenase / diacetyl reductase
MRRLVGKVALITGTGGGQGREAARVFSEHGGLVIGCDLNAEEAERTVTEVRRAGWNMHSMHPVDLGDLSSATAWVDEAAAIHGRIDVVYNNAAAARNRMFSDLDEEAWHYTYRNEVDLVYHVSKAAWPYLKKGGGSLINVGSIAALIGSEIGNVAHGSAKAAVIAMSRHLAAEGSRYDIRVNTVTPGAIEIPGTTQIEHDNDFMEFYLRHTPARRLGSARDVINAALYLASDESRFVTGSNIVVDGGYSISKFLRA